MRDCGYLKAACAAAISSGQEAQSKPELQVTLPTAVPPSHHDRFTICGSSIATRLAKGTAAPVVVEIATSALCASVIELHASGDEVSIESVVGAV